MNHCEQCELSGKSDNSQQAIAITQDEMSCFYMAKFSLLTNSDLSEDDIAFASNYICSLYSYNIISDEQLILIFTYVNQSTICKFALIFNSQLTNAIKNRDTHSLRKLVSGPKEMFIEVYDNPYLSRDDKVFTLRLLARERYTVEMLFQQLKSRIEYCRTVDLRPSCISQVETDFTHKILNLSSLYAEFYDKVCFEYGELLNDDVIRTQMTKHEKYPDSIYTVDKPVNSHVPQVFCFSLFELFDSVLSDNPINPKTGELFSQYTITLINNRFNKELNMYRRYRDYLSNLSQ